MANRVSIKAKTANNLNVNESYNIKDETLSKEKLKELYKNGGIQSMEPLKHKNGKLYTDAEYLILMADLCDEMDRDNDSSLPTKYPYDLNVVKFAREIKKSYNEGVSLATLNKYIRQCIEI